ncbi:MAG: hypothetical protein WDA30_27785 [Mycolicibacterium sp.]
MFIVLAFVIPAAVYVACRPLASVPSARVRAAIAALAAAVIWATAVYSAPGSGTFVIQLVCGALLVGVAVALLVKGRQPPVG